MSKLRALILDLGEVLVHSQPAELVARMAEVAEVPLEALRRSYWAHRNEYDRTGSAQAYWDAVLRESQSPLDAAGRDAARRQLVELDILSWSVYREEVWELTARFRDLGGSTAMLTNCGPEIVNRVKAEHSAARFFDVVVASFEVGSLKPEPAIFQLTLERLGALPSEALFVDDRAVNIDAAAALGLGTLHFQGDASTERLRERLSLSRAEKSAAG